MSVGSTEQYINKLVQLSRFLKGSTSIPELDNMTVQQVHTIYKVYIKYNIDRNKAMEEQDKKDRVNNNMERQRAAQAAKSRGLPMGDPDELEDLMEDMFE